MKVKNDYVIIKNNNQEIKIHNVILDTYIEDIIFNQMEKEARKNLSMYYIFLKFDTELNFDKTSKLTNDSFDLFFGAYNYNTEPSKKDIINNYMYKLEKGTMATDVSTGEEINSFEKYNGKKITAIGFGSSWYNNLYACLDTRNYNIYLDITQVLSITRRDILSTDGYFYSKDRVIQCPVHLINGIGINNPTTGLYKTYYGILKSIGLGINTFRMLEEHTLLPYPEHIEIDNNIIKVSNELTIEYENEGLFPSKDIYPLESLYPARIIKKALYPSKDIYPNIDLYPVYAPYQFIQLKYEIYYIDNEEARAVDTGNYYLISVPIDNKRKIKMNILYERA